MAHHSDDCRYNCFGNECRGATNAQRALESIELERDQQDRKWGFQTHPDGTSPDFADLAARAKARCDAQEVAGTQDWASILTEEVFEAFCETDPELLAEELIQVAAVATAWLEDIWQRQ